ncbi:HEAT repeat-containing protein 3-like [Argiope bruennichi]|uniref:HEAT repeat-containing protein 3 n=1 Tax=Argiope bruennichi TaxID=94029 RepID=A0A8T0EWG0_ARGBR|nr:HEAT repeat-containing protein 3-like [Argiope bruennichi]KAF8782676.1 HEAT repeat-containing protein 3 [Argiope bruennichi]
MGKVKNKKYKCKQVNPVGLPSVKEMEFGLDEFLTTENIDAGFIESVKEKLLSTRAEDRECGAVIIANLANNKEFVSSLIEKKVIKVASPLLVDKNVAVRHAIAGCLRNIAVCGDYTVSEAMIEQDVMTSLVTLFGMYKTPWTPVAVTENKIDSKQEIFLEACNLLWNLCENSDMAVRIFNENDLVSILLPCLKVDVFGFSVPIAVANCLYTISENNKYLRDILRQPTVDTELKDLMSLPGNSPEEVLLKALAAGIKLNLFANQFDNSMGDTTVLVLEIISSTFDNPVEPCLEVLSKLVVYHKDRKMKAANEENDLEDKLAALNKTLDNIVHILSAKQASLEILGNLFEDEDDEAWEDISSSDSEELLLDTGGMEIDEGISANELELSFPPEVHQIIVNGNIWEKVAQQILYPSDEIIQILQSHSKTKDCLKRINTVRCTALLCLNNIIQKLKVDELGGPEKLWNLWLHLGTLLFKKTDLNDTDQVEALTRVLSAVVKQLAEAKCSSQFSHMTESDLQLLMNISSQSQDSCIKVHIVYIMGTIGSMLGNIDSPASASLIRVIGSFLLDICLKSNDMWVTAETLDKIFDVFAEDHVDFIAREIGLIEKLTHLVPVLKAKIKQQKKNLSDHLVVITTAKTNLLRFIRYKNDLNKK